MGSQMLSVMCEQLLIDCYEKQSHIKQMTDNLWLDVKLQMKVKLGIQSRRASHLVPQEWCKK